MDALPGVIVANKVDLRERLVVTRQQGQQMAASLNMPYFETSALDAILRRPSRSSASCCTAATESPRARSEAGRPSAP